MQLQLALRLLKKSFKNKINNNNLRRRVYLIYQAPRARVRVGLRERLIEDARIHVHAQTELLPHS